MGVSLSQGPMLCDEMSDQKFLLCGHPRASPLTESSPNIVVETIWQLYETRMERRMGNTDIAEEWN